MWLYWQSIIDLFRAIGRLVHHTVENDNSERVNLYFKIFKSSEISCANCLLLKQEVSGLKVEEANTRLSPLQESSHCVVDTEPSPAANPPAGRTETECTHELHNLSCQACNPQGQFLRLWPKQVLVRTCFHISRSSLKAQSKQHFKEVNVVTKSICHFSLWNLQFSWSLIPV